MHTCGVKGDGTLACWGDNTYGQLNKPGGTFLQVSAGYADVMFQYGASGDTMLVWR